MIELEISLLSDWLCYVCAYSIFLPNRKVPHGQYKQKEMVNIF